MGTVHGIYMQEALSNVCARQQYSSTISCYLYIDDMFRGNLHGYIIAETGYVCARSTFAICQQMTIVYICAHKQTSSRRHKLKAIKLSSGQRDRELERAKTRAREGKTEQLYRTTDGKAI